MRSGRRDFLRLTGSAAAVLATTPWLTSCLTPTPPPPPEESGVGYGPLEPADANGLRLPVGFSSRVVATSGAAVAATGLVLRAAPDGGACFPAAAGGWSYVFNHELAPGGGVTAIEFAADGTIVDARSILDGTRRNCAGGATPWGTWLSCEEVAHGLVYECDPTGVAAAVAHPAMGLFNHEAVVAVPAHGALYLTEDRSDGGLYRFTPDTWGDLSSGLLEVMTADGGVLGWAEVPDPSAALAETRYQVPTMRLFAGGEGITLHDGDVYFTTKVDNRVWRYRAADNSLFEVYHAATAAEPVLTGVDNITNTTTGELLVAEDGGNMQIVLLAMGMVQEVVQLDGVTGSEITGPAFSPDGTRLYFSSQRNPGQVFEVTGPWHNA